jgi:predicted ATPase
MLKRIGFDNFKCLSGKSFNLDKVNVFTGYNGRGKSSVMQAILMLSQSVRKDDMNSIAHLHVNGDFVKLGDFDELLTDSDKYKFGLDLTISNGKAHELHLGYDMTDDYKVGQLYECTIDEVSFFDTASSMPLAQASNKDGKKGDLKDLKQLPVYLYNQFWSQNVHFVAADRKGPVKFVERDEIPDVFRVGADGSRTINTLSAYKDKVSKVMNIADDDDKEYDLQTAVTMWINEIMHGGCVSVVGNATRAMDEQGNPKKSTILKLDFGVKDDGHTYPSYHVGFGYSYILSIVVTALIAKENDIVIIENPEAHLHPEAQTRLTFLLAKLGARGVQVFVETHSEHVISGFRLAALKKEYALNNEDVRIFFFDYDFNMIPLKIEPNGKIPGWPDRFFDQYQQELAEILKLGAQVSH